jgi:hypothetical protein
MPIQLASPTVTPPARCAPGLTCTPSAKAQSWSMVAAVLMMQLRPTVLSTLTTAPANATVPSAILAYRLTTARGWTMVTRWAPDPMSFRVRSRRVRLLPMPTTTPS